MHKICSFNTYIFTHHKQLSTLAHWKREFEAWTDLNVIVYHGSKADREMIRLYEWRFWDSQGRETHKTHLKFNVLIATFESLMADASTLTKIKWRMCIVDEVSFPGCIQPTPSRSLLSPRILLTVFCSTFNFSFTSRRRGVNVKKKRIQCYVPYHT